MQQHTKNTSQTKQGICIKIAIFTALLSTFYLLPSAQHVSAQSYDWSIDSFDSVIEIHEDASITVTETIDVDFDIEKHGIYREIPIRYTDPYGNSFKTDFDVLSILQDGQKAKVEYTHGYSDLSLRIGDPDRYITGNHTYEITYTVDRVFLYFDDYDELYWNVTGSDWEVPIDYVSAIVILPDGAEVEQSECYTGNYGSTAQECQKLDQGNSAEFEANDFLTVAVGFTKGLIYEPTAWDRFILLILDNWFGLIPLLIAIFVFRIWWTKGRDPKMTRTVVAEYEPPKGIKAVHAGLLAFGKLKADVFASMIVQLAVDGVLTIESKEPKKTLGIFKQNPEIILHPKKDSKDLDDAHAQLHEILFKGKMEPKSLALIKGTISTHKLSKLRKTLRDWLVEEGYYTKHSFARQGGFIAGGVILCGLSIVVGASLFGLFTAVCGVSSGIVVIILGYLMPALTREGLEMKRKVLGFKEFMHTAERYRSAWNEKENIFADYLPYAIAFNDVEKWAKTFEGMKQAAPDWYNGHTSLLILASSGQFGTMTDSIRSATSTPSSSGGSSGGGFSGGGFGGGGGGSW